MKAILLSIREELNTLASAEGKAAAQKFHKGEIRVYGIKNPVVRKLSRQVLREVKPLGKDKVFDMCSNLFQSGYIEEALIASDWVYAFRREFQKGDFQRFKDWIENCVNNWATCDDFCNNSVGSFLLLYPDYVPRLKKWAVAKNRWLQRASAVSLILPARAGKFVEESFEIAELLLESEDDMVQKGYGWLLKSVSKHHPDAVEKFVEERKDVMPRTALRYAIEHFEDGVRMRLMGKG